MLLFFGVWVYMCDHTPIVNVMMCIILYLISYYMNSCHLHAYAIWYQFYNEFGIFAKSVESQTHINSMMN